MLNRVKIISEKKTFSPPKISLLKGGGAIHNIGQKIATIDQLIHLRLVKLYQNDLLWLILKI